MIANERLNSLRQKFASMPFCKYLDMQLVGLDEGLASVRIPFREELTQYLSTIHGAVITAAADSAVAVALLTRLQADARVTTIEMKVNFLRGVSGSDIVATAKIIHLGATIALGDVDIRDRDRNLIAKCTATYMILEKR